MTPNSTEERIALRFLGEAFRNIDLPPLSREDLADIGRSLEALTRTDNDVSGLVEALEMARGYVVNVVEAEGHKFNRNDLSAIDTALAKHRQSNGGAA